MVRFVVSFAAWMVFGNWVYDEIQVSFPNAVPFINAAMEKVSIPTHDKWNQERIIGAINSVGSTVNSISGASFPELRKIEQQLDKPSALAMLDAKKTRRGFEHF